MASELEKSLVELNQELDRHPGLSDEERKALTALAKRIESQNSSEESEELQKWTIQFRESHPALSKVITKVFDSLSAMGI